MNVKTFRELNDTGKEDFIYFFNINGGVYRGIVEYNGARFGDALIELRDVRKLNGHFWETPKDLDEKIRINLDSLDSCCSYDLENFYVSDESIFYYCSRVMKFKSRIMAKKFSDVFDGLMFNENV